MNNEFIKNLKKALERENMSQGVLAEKTGCTEVSISRYLSGKRVPKGPVIVKMAKALNVTPNFLLGFEEHRMTNADRIRNMSDEKMAKYIDNLDYPENKANCLGCKETSCYKCLLKCLQKEVVEDGQNTL